ncbi:coiled-coil domain-containing protein 40 isoform X1 [Pygocentrus nattereri]|uniref:Coiled-coil domain containing 40 n=1 Tax=Pygocentrus nattereri TaxID=42514 RepID=A0A3B4D909_PYGNA|nr:coiled-coil domain-containing protein 40 isoform X1 [Pygocentrus nattereri]XP_017548394.2 coiled-coil domain-containing protein 40 isoform X1 [Pygocentrus nattereri]
MESVEGDGGRGRMEGLPEESAEVPGGDQVESSAHDPVSHTHSEWDSGDLPDPLASSLHLTLANSTAGLIDGESDERSRTMQNDEDEEDEDEEVIVLDPEHPLMKRFQSALKKHLTKQLERLELELREKVALERAEGGRRENLGVELYSVQQELVRLQAFLEGRHEATAQASAERRQAQEHLEHIRNQYRTVAGQASTQHTQVSELQSEVEKLALRLLYMQEVTSDLRSDITAMKNATHKAKAEKLQAEQQKHKQDLYVERLVKQVEKLREQIALYEAQTLAQAEETRAAKETLAEAQLEIDSLTVEQKQLLQQWNSSLIGMKRRDEALTATQEALRHADQQVRSLDTEVEGYKRSITKEQEQNELLTVLLNRTQLNSATYHKLITHSNSQQEALQALYSTYSRTLQETEKSLSRVTTECNACQSELTVLRKQLEKESSVRLDLEDKIVKKMQEQLTHDNAAKYSKHLTNKTIAHQRDRETQLCKLENELAAVTLETSQVALHLEALAGLQADLEQEMRRRHQLLTASEAEGAKCITAIECKQATINVYNKKIQQIVASTGHEDLGPLEIQASTLNKQLEEVGAEIKEKQQLWLWQQGELVRLSQERQAQNSAAQNLQTQLTILQQRKIRTESDIEQEQGGLSELERHSKALMLDLQKLNSLLSQNTQQSQELQQSNSLMESSFIQQLKDAERESVEMQLLLEKIQEEKERLLNSLVESERQIMLWEKKTQLVRETRSAVDSEVGKGEIHTMKAEIHRMEVHYGHLLKQQQQLLRDMEAAVARRESIFTQSEAQARSDRKHPTHTDLRHTLQALRNNILHTHKQVEECDTVLAELQEKQNSVSEGLKQKQLQISDLHNTSTALSTDLHDLQETRESNLAQLLALQFRAKQLQAVKEGCYSTTATGEAALKEATQKQRERLCSVSGVLQHVVQDFPQHESALRKINLLLSARTPAPADHQRA